MAKSRAIERLPENRRMATLVSFVLTLEASALDDSLDLLDILITEIFSNATKTGEKARLRTIKDLDAAAIKLGQACRLILDYSIPDEWLRQAVLTKTNGEELETALRQLDSLVRHPEDMYYKELLQSWLRVSRFLPALLNTIRFGSTPAGKPVADALEYLAKPENRSALTRPPVDIVSKGWRKYVIGDNDIIDRKAYVFCCLDRLRSALRRRDLFVAPSLRYSDARIGLLSGAAWTAARSSICNQCAHVPTRCYLSHCRRQSVF